MMAEDDAPPPDSIALHLMLASVGLKAILDNLPALLAAPGVPAEKS